MSDRSSSGGVFIGGLLLGAAAGAVAGLLFAPKTGRETRQLIKQSTEALPELAEDLSATVQIQAERLSESAVRNWDNTLLRLREAIEAGIEASRQVEPPSQSAMTLSSSLPETQSGRDATNISIGSSPTGSPPTGSASIVPPV